MNRQLSKEAAEFGAFYVVATPIGNLADISLRALQVLKEVDLVLAEDTRHSKRLFDHHGINNKLKACHDHNEQGLLDWVDQQLVEGVNIALVSDAGTPLISDPGFNVVRHLRERQHRVYVVPGASSVIAALSVAGLPTDRFIFDGFLPNKTGARKSSYELYLSQPRTVVLLESSHRILASCVDLVEVLGPDREIVVARELTKKFETVLSGSASDVLQQLQEDENQTRGEFVLMIKGVQVEQDQEQLQRTLKVLLDELPLKQASAITAKLTGERKNDVYQLALSMKAQT